MAAAKYAPIKPGDQFGYLTALSVAEKTTSGRRWECRCICGGTSLVYEHALKTRRPRSCGCKKGELITAANKGRALRPSPPAKERFSKLHRQDDSSGCWLWTGAIGTNGYGAFRIDGRSQNAQRASWIIFRGVIPDGLSICHRCDNPKCVNPEHLFLGTHRDNMRDMVEKGRNGHHGLFGEAHQNHKLTTTQVLRMRAEHAVGGITYQALADKFGVGQKTAWQIIRRELWPHV